MRSKVLPSKASPSVCRTKLLGPSQPTRYLASMICDAPSGLLTCVLTPLSPAENVSSSAFHKTFLLWLCRYSSRSCSVLLCSNINTKGKGLSPFPMLEKSSSPRTSPSISKRALVEQLLLGRRPHVLNRSDRKSQGCGLVRQSLWSTG